MEINKTKSELNNNFNIKAYLYNSLLSKRRSDQNPLMKYSVIIISLLILLLFTILIINKHKQITAMQSKISDASTDFTINDIKLKQDLEFVLEEKNLKIALIDEKNTIEGTIQPLQNKQAKFKQLIAQYQREKEYAITYANEKNREVSLKKQKIQDNQVRLYQLKKENYDLTDQLNTLRNNKNKIPQKDGENLQGRDDMQVESSSILSFEDKLFLEHLTGVKFSYKCFSSIRYGLDPIKFHALCDYVGPTLFVIQTTRNEVYAGFTKRSWVGDKPLEDRSAMIFNLKTRQSFTVLNENQAISPNPNYFVQFGKDLIVYITKGWSEYPYHYKPIANDVPAFDQMFEVAMIEVFYSNIAGEKVHYA